MINLLNGWKHGKRRHGCQGKNLFSKDNTWQMSILCWFIIWKFIFWILNLIVHVKYKYILIINWFYIIYYAFNPSMTKIWTIFCCKGHIFKTHNFQSQKHIWTIRLVLWNVHSLIGWLFWLCFYLNAQFVPLCSSLQLPLGLFIVSSCVSVNVVIDW